jgi:hypothetical protein
MMYRPINKTNQPNPFFSLDPSIVLLNWSPINIPRIARAVIDKSKNQFIT